MEFFLHQLFSGIATGSVYGSLALALVMIYRSTHHVNFAQGEMAMFSTFLAWIAMQNGLPYWLAFGLSVGLSFLGGMLLERVLIRRFHAAPHLVVVIVLVALLIVFNSVASSGGALLTMGASAAISAERAPQMPTHSMRGSTSTPASISAEAKSWRTPLMPTIYAFPSGRLISHNLSYVKSLIGADEVKKCQVVARPFFITCCHWPKLLDPVKKRSTKLRSLASAPDCPTHQRLHESCSSIHHASGRSLEDRLFLGAGRTLVGAHRRAVDHQRFQIAIATDRFDDPLPYAGLAPAVEPRVGRVPAPPVPQASPAKATPFARSTTPPPKTADYPGRRTAISRLARQ
jgi:hypothetical protein